VVKKNEVATEVKCVAASGGPTCSDNVRAAAFNASDLILVEATYPGSNGGTNPSWSGTCQ
jgi:hypothetical protein